MTETGIWDAEEAAVQHSVSPVLARILPSFFPKDVPIVDYGCGTGFYVDALRDAGFEVTGIEGTPGLSDAIVADLSQPLTVDLPRSNSLSLEVGEHIPAEFEDVFLRNITRACTGRLVLSWAIPGQGGHGHVNEQDNLYVVETLAHLGFALQYVETEFLRSHFGAGTLAWWFRNSLFVFDRYEDRRV